MKAIWEHIVRLRTLLINGAGVLLMLLPDLLNAPEVLAVIPTSYHKWVFLSVFILNIAMRPRPASIATDVDVQVRKAVKQAEKEGGSATVVVHSDVAAPINITPGAKA